MLDASRGCFSLSFAVCNSPALRTHLIEELRSSDPGIDVVVVSTETTDVFGSVAASTRAADRTALFVVGLEESLDSTKTRQPALASLNASRELWENHYPCPVVFWLPEFAVALLSQEARDFFRYRSHRFEFVSDQAAPVAALADRFSGDLSAAASLSADEKRFRIAELEQRISQAGDPPSENLVNHVLVWMNELFSLYLSIGDLANAETVVKKSLALEEKAGDLKGMAINYGNLGIVYETRGQLDAAEEMHKKSLAIDEKLGRLEGMAAQYGNFGNVYAARGDLDSAEAMYRKSLAINEKLGRLEGVATCYGNLGNVYDTHGDLDAAEAMYKKSLAINEKLGHLAGIANAWSAIGIVYARRGDLAAAEAMCKKSLAINEKLGLLEGIADQHVNLGNVDGIRGDVKAAREHWTQARDLYSKIGMPDMVKDTQSQLDSLPPP